MSAAQSARNSDNAMASRGSLVTVREPKTWVEEMALSFPPSVVLWRTVEAQAVRGAFSRHGVRRPILDVGCGEGVFGSIVFGKNSLDFGLEIEEPLVKAAAASGTYLHTVLGDGTEFPFADGYFATVFSNSVIEHIDGLDPVLAEIARVLEPMGLFIATVPSSTLADGLYFKRRLSSLGFSVLAGAYATAVNRKLHHVNLHGADAWRARLSNAGLDLIEAMPYLGVHAVEAWDKLSIEYFIRRHLGISMPRHDELVRSVISNEGSDPFGALLLVARKCGGSS